MSDPTDTITSLINVQKNGGWSPTFAVIPTALMSTFFSAGFNSDWAAAMQYNNIFPVLDGDPLTGYMSASGLSLAGTTTAASTATTATINASIVATIDPGPVMCNVTFSMVLENNVWKVDDINSNLTSIAANGSTVAQGWLRANLQSVAASAASLPAPTTGPIAGFTSPLINSIATAQQASGKVYGTGGAVSLVEVLAGTGNGASFVQADGVLGNDVPYGTVVATFNYDGAYGPPDYPNGISLKAHPDRGSHVAILVAQVFDDPGSGLYLFGQWEGQAANIKYYSAYGNGGDCAANYYVVA